MWRSRRSGLPFSFWTVADSPLAVSLTFSISTHINGKNIVCCFIFFNMYPNNNVMGEWLPPSLAKVAITFGLSD